MGRARARRVPRANPERLNAAAARRFGPDCPLREGLALELGSDVWTLVRARRGQRGHVEDGQGRPLVWAWQGEQLRLDLPDTRGAQQLGLFGGAP